MKFLSNFDTELEVRVVENYIKMYGREKVYVIHRAMIFWVFFCVFPMISLLILLLLIIAFMKFDLGDESLNSLKSLLGRIFILISVTVLGYRILKRYFDYKMDFCVVTPQEVVSYNQAGLLSRTSRTIDADKIKTVSVVNTSGIIKSIFNYGDLVFLSEGDSSSGTGDINLNFIHNVNHVKNVVRDLIEPHLHHKKGPHSNEL